MVLLHDFRDDPEWIARRLSKKVSSAQARESIELLLRLQFLKRTENSGKLKQSTPIITTSDETSNLIIRHLHKQFVELGLISLKIN